MSPKSSAELSKRSWRCSSALRHTIQEEENIGAAFASSMRLREEWNQVGDVPGDQYKEVHDQYYRLQDEFFYNITIYKELKDHDLKVNLKKEGRAYGKSQELWLRWNPSKNAKKKPACCRNNGSTSGPRHGKLTRNWPINSSVSSALYFEEVKAHYEQVKATFQGHADKKIALVEQLRAVVAEEVPQAMMPGKPPLRKSDRIATRVENHWVRGKGSKRSVVGPVPGIGGRILREEAAVLRLLKKRPQKPSKSRRSR